MHWIQRKKLQLCAKYHFWKNQEIPAHNAHFKPFWPILTILSNFFFISSKMLMWTELGFFFTLYLLHQNPSFELSKLTFRQVFWLFTLRGDPYDFGVVKSYPEKKVKKNFKKQKNLKDWIKWNRKMGGKVPRSKVLISRTLYCTVPSSTGPVDMIVYKWLYRCAWLFSAKLTLQCMVDCAVHCWLYYVQVYVYCKFDNTLHSWKYTVDCIVQSLMYSA